MYVYFYRMCIDVFEISNEIILTAIDILFLNLSETLSNGTELMCWTVFIYATGNSL
jgi:hypothetical protein